MNNYFIIEEIECLGDKGYILYQQVGINKDKLFTSFNKEEFRDVYFAIYKHHRVTAETIGIEYISMESSSIYYKLEEEL